MILFTDLVSAVHRVIETQVRLVPAGARVKTKEEKASWAWWRTPLIPVVWRQRQVDEFEAGLFYIVGSRTVRAT